MKAPLTIRAEVQDLAKWQERAEKAGLSLSEWIRRKCNDTVMHEVVREKVVRGPKEVPLAERGTGLFCRHGIAFGKVCFGCAGYAKEGE